MVAKVLGLVTGALVASVAVAGFTAWRHVDDEDLLMSALRDHCLGYVLNGDTPFVGIGRAIGVYDNDFVDARMKNGDAVIVFDARFIASWGEIDATQNLRVCRIDGRSTGASRQSLDIDADGFLGRITDAARALGDLRPDADSTMSGDDSDDIFQTISWRDENAAQYEGNRIVLFVVQLRVANMIVVRDLGQ